MKNQKKYKEMLVICLNGMRGSSRNIRCKENKNKFKLKEKNL